MSKAANYSIRLFKQDGEVLTTWDFYMESGELAACHAATCLDNTPGATRAEYRKLSNWRWKAVEAS